jgi:hypothetical protein
MTGTVLFIIALLSDREIITGKPEFDKRGSEIEESSSLMDEIFSPAIHFCIAS